MSKTAGGARCSRSTRVTSRARFQPPIQLRCIDCTYFNPLARSLSLSLHRPSPLSPSVLHFFPCFFRSFPTRYSPLRRGQRTSPEDPPDGNHVPLSPRKEAKKPGKPINYSLSAINPLGACAIRENNAAIPRARLRRAQRLSAWISARARSQNPREMFPRCAILSRARIRVYVYTHEHTLAKIAGEDPMQRIPRDMEPGRRRLAATYAPCKMQRLYCK